jgi:hypothetical protein
MIIIGAVSFVNGAVDFPGVVSLQYSDEMPQTGDAG